MVYSALYLCQLMHNTAAVSVFTHLSSLRIGLGERCVGDAEIERTTGSLVAISDSEAAAAKLNLSVHRSTKTRVQYIDTAGLLLPVIYEGGTPISHVSFVYTSYKYDNFRRERATHVCIYRLET